MDDQVMMILGIVGGVALLYLGSRIRRRSLQRPRPPEDPGRDDSA
jgi:threonine/homoserine/homoserine lactone efflux protein